MAIASDLRAIQLHWLRTVHDSDDVSGFAPWPLICLEARPGGQG